MKVLVCHIKIQQGHFHLFRFKYQTFHWENLFYSIKQLPQEYF